MGRSPLRFENGSNNTAHRPAGRLQRIVGSGDRLSKFNIAAVSYLENRDRGFTHILFAPQQGNAPVWCAPA
jgi:hypothetical protein